MQPIRVLFVCLGNICRSPAAEAIFKKIVESRNLSEKFIIDSAGTSGYHDGEMADARMRTTALKHDYEIMSISRKFTSDDFKKFDYIIAMDQSNKSNMLKISSNPKDQEKIYLMTDFKSRFELEEVPDPYFGGEAGFELVIRLLEDCCEGLLMHINKTSGV